VGQGHLEQALRVYVEHYDRHRPHRALSLNALDPPNVRTVSKDHPGRLHRRDLLGGRVHEYRRAELHERICAPHRIELTPEALRAFAASLCVSDEVALEATGNTHAVARLLERHVGRVVVSNPQKTRAIAEAKVKTDKVDAAVLAGLLAADYLPAVWLPDEATFALRRQVARRAHIVRQRTRLQEPGAVDPPAATSSRAARPPTCSAARAAPGWPPRTYQQTSSRRSGRCCASSTSTPLSCGSSTPSSSGPRWTAPRCAGC
jgi:hypothetical protein